jgi:hypothetical protein
MIEVLRLALKALNAGEHAHLVMNTDGIKDKVRQAIAELESQEPVALETVYETIIQWDEGGGKRSRRDLARRIIDLYTHPPQRTEQEPVAWMHIMDNTEGIKANGAGIVSITQKRKHPFGKAGIDFSKSYPVTSTPLYTHPPQRTEQNFCPRCGKRTNDIHTCTPPTENT